jgi:hypothetical protein
MGFRRVPGRTPTTSLRQRHLHRLAHRLSGCDRGRLLPDHRGCDQPGNPCSSANSSTAPRACRAACCAACWRVPTRWASGQRLVSNTNLRPAETLLDPREGLPQPEADLAGFFAIRAAQPVLSDWHKDLPGVR